jgi:hypothetical protein
MSLSTSWRRMGDMTYSSTEAYSRCCIELSGQNHATAALQPVNDSGFHCIGVWVGARASLDVSDNPGSSIVGPSCGTDQATSVFFYNLLIHILVACTSFQVTTFSPTFCFLLQFSSSLNREFSKKLRCIFLSPLTSQRFLQSLLFQSLMARLGALS